MIKEKRTISFIGLNKSIVGMIAAYCHLLKRQLLDTWIVHRIDDNADVIIIAEGYEDKINDNTHVKIIIEHENSIKNNSNMNEFHITYPVSGAKILNVLNKISNLKSIKKYGLKEKYGLKDKISFSFKNIFSKFLTKKISYSPPEKESTVNETQNNNKKQEVANNLLKILNPNTPHKPLKVVFLGRPGSGKTTAISSVAVDNVLTSEVSATDSISLIKQQTTIGIDYGEFYSKNGIKLRLYGTPGQIRYDYVQIQTVAHADIYIILVDLSSVAPFAEFMYYKNIIKNAGNESALKVVAFTHYDIKEHNMNQLSKEIRHKCHDEILTSQIDTRVGDEVRFMLEKIAEIRLGNIEPAQYYTNNGLFLTNINV